LYFLSFEEISPTAFFLSYRPKHLQEREVRIYSKAKRVKKFRAKLIKEWNETGLLDEVKKKIEETNLKKRKNKGKKKRLEEKEFKHKGKKRDKESKTTTKKLLGPKKQTLKAKKEPQGNLKEKGAKGVKKADKSQLSQARLASYGIDKKS